ERASEFEHLQGAFTSGAAEAATGSDRAAGAHQRHVARGEKIKRVKSFLLRNVSDNAGTFTVFDTATQGRDDARNGFEKRAFANAVGAKHRFEAAMVNLQVEPRKNRPSSITDINVAKSNSRFNGVLVRTWRHDQCANNGAEMTLSQRVSRAGV